MSCKNLTAMQISFINSAASVQKKGNQFPLDGKETNYYITSFVEWLLFLDPCEQFSTFHTVKSKHVLVTLFHALHVYTANVCFSYSHDVVTIFDFCQWIHCFFPSFPNFFEALFRSRSHSKFGKCRTFYLSTNLK